MAIVGTPPPVIRQPEPPRPNGGITQDAPARTSLNDLIDALVAAGVLTPPA